MTLGEIITIVSIFLGSTWFGNLIIEIYKNKRKKLTPYERMVLGLTRDRLLKLSKEYLQQGYIPEDEYESFHELGQSYLAAHGNSIVKKKYEQAENLPVQVEL